MDGVPAVFSGGAAAGIFVRAFADAELGAAGAGMGACGAAGGEFADVADFAARGVAADGAGPACTAYFDGAGADGGAAVFSAVIDDAAVAGVVREGEGGRESLPAVCAFERGIAPGAVELSDFF